MQILKYKNCDKDFDHVFDYKTLTNQQTLKTRDKARQEFFHELNLLVKCTVAYVGIEGKHKSFSLKSVVFPTAKTLGSVSIALKNTETSSDSFVTTKLNNVHVFLSEDLDVVDPGSKKNALLDELDKFYACCEKFLQGDREQQTLPFEEGVSVGTIDNEQDLFMGA